MRIVWDEPKRQKTLADRRLDFAWLTLDFFESAVIEPAHDGRFKATGILNGMGIRGDLQAARHRRALGDFHATSKQEGKATL
jgi:uncharacterized DUF497 family protein